MSTSRQDQQLIMRHILTAWGLSLGFIGLGVWVTVQTPLLRGWSVEQSTAFAVLLVGTSLMIGVCAAARARHFESNIDGSRPAPLSHLDILLRYVTNTTEQVVLFALAGVAMAILAPQVAQPLLPVAACWFVIARAAFYVGYVNNPLSRAIGFAGTFHPTMLMFAFDFFWLFWG